MSKELCPICKTEHNWNVEPFYNCTKCKKTFCLSGKCRLQHARECSETPVGILNPAHKITLRVTND